MYFMYVFYVCLYTNSHRFLGFTPRKAARVQAHTRVVLSRRASCLCLWYCDCWELVGSGHHPETISSSSLFLSSTTTIYMNPKYLETKESLTAFRVTLKSGVVFVWKDCINRTSWRRLLQFLWFWIFGAGTLGACVFIGLQRGPWRSRHWVVS